MLFELLSALQHLPFLVEGFIFPETDIGLLHLGKLVLQKLPLPL